MPLPPDATARNGTPLLEAQALTKHFTVRRGALGWATGLVRAVDTVSFTIEAGTTLGLVGESGCGKTTTSKLILGLERPTAGTIRFEGRDVHALGRAGEREYRRDRKSTRLNSSHLVISYAVFCLKKKKQDKATRAR